MVDDLSRAAGTRRQRAARRQGTLSLLVAVLAVAAGCAGSKAPGTTAEPTEGERPSATEKDATAAAPTLPAAPTLADYLKYAELNNPQLRAAFDRWQAALEQVRQAKTLPEPRLSYTDYVESVETRVGPQRWNVSLAQTFPWFGKLSLRGTMALAAANVARQQYEAARLKLTFDVTRGYYELYYLARAIAVTDENVQLLGGLEEVALARYRAGAAPHSAVIRAQIELGKLQDRLKTLRDLQGPLAAKLNAALGRPAEAAVAWPDQISTEAIAITSEQLLRWLEQNNPELKALDFMAAKETAAAALARKDRFPDVTLGVTYISTDEAIMPGTKDSGKDPVMAMVSVNVPLWLRKYAAAEREARARLAAVIAERRDKQNTLSADVELAWYNVRDAERKIALYRDTLVPEADQGLKVTQQAFTAGTADFLDLIDAERTLLELQLLYERARADREERLAELEMLVGRALSPAQPDASTEPKPDQGTLENREAH